MIKKLDSQQRDKNLLIIAGSDPSGGAGIQADLKTATANKVYASCAITCLTAQNTQGVSAVFNPSVKFLHQQLTALFDDIKFSAIKIGMLGNSDIVNCVADVLEKKAKKIPVILDTVMVSTSGDLLLEKNAVESLKSRLLRECFLATPNIDEAQVLINKKIKTLNDMKNAALIIKNMGAKNVLVKGGHLDLGNGKIISVFLDEKGIFHLISNKRIGNSNIHGTGCTLSSAIACNILKGEKILTAIRKSNSYVVRSIIKKLKIGKGSFVLRHF